MIKFGITSDISNENVNIDEYVIQSNMVHDDGEGNDDDDDDDNENSSLLRGGLPLRGGGTGDIINNDQFNTKLASIDLEEGSPIKTGTGEGLMMRVYSREKMNVDDEVIDVNRSPSESALGPKAPNADEMLAITHSHPVATRSDSISDEINRSKKAASKKKRTRTHREKYGIIDGARLPATRNRSGSNDSGAGSDDNSIAIKRSLSMDRKDLGEERLTHLVRGLSYDHNA